MNRLNQQEKQQPIQKLRQLLQSVPVETKEEHEWQLLENTIMARLEDTQKRTPLKREIPLFNSLFQLFPRPIMAVATAACLILMLGAGSFYYTFHSSPQPLVNSKVLGMK